jgi:hypothetical protein
MKFLESYKGIFAHKINFFVQKLQVTVKMLKNNMLIYFATTFQLNYKKDHKIISNYLTKFRLNFHSNLEIGQLYFYYGQI